MDVEERPVSPTLAGSKRKRTTEPKFYAVFEGREPGVYHSWNDCLSQVKGHKNASFKSFTTLQEAEHFVNSGSAPRQTGKTPAKYYGIHNGRTPGVYTDWNSAQAQILGWTKPRYKSFPTRAEAEAFVRDGDAVTSTPEIASSRDSPASNGAKPATKKQKRKGEEIDTTQLEDVDYEAGEGPLPADTEDGFDPRVTLNPATGNVEYKNHAEMSKTKWQATAPADEGMLRIYTDGSSLGNGANGAVAGVGVYFGPNDKRNVSEALSGARQTNQRAELTAILRALELSPRDRPLTIYSDSSYAINCVTVWYQKWRSSNWVTASKKPVENRDLVEKILALLEDRERISNKYATSQKGTSEEGSSERKGRARVEFVWVKGHKDNAGNNAADRLAVAGARDAKERLGSE